MKSSAFRGGRFIPVLAFLIILSTFISCSNNNNSNQAANNQNSNSAQNSSRGMDANDDAEQLAQKVKLPLMPQDVLWTESTQSAANVNEKKLTAVMRFTDVDSEALAQQLQKASPPMNITVDTEEWFPPELIAESETTGDQTVKGKMFDARDFLQDPYKKGRIVKLEQAGYFVLELTTF